MAFIESIINIVNALTFRPSTKVFVQTGVTQTDFGVEYLDGFDGDVVGANPIEGIIFVRHADEIVRVPGHQVMPFSKTQGTTT